MIKSNKKYIILLHLFLCIYSLFGIASKTASNYSLLSFEFVACYGVVILGLAIYAFVWQQMLKKMPLISAYANKSVTVIWGIIWGHIFFGEIISIYKIIGAVVIICGIILVVTADGKVDENK